MKKTEQTDKTNKTVANQKEKPTGQIILRLDRMMVERKISLNDLARRVGISHVNLSKIKNNKVTAIRFSTLAAICETLQCQPGDILEYQPCADRQVE